MFLSFTCVNIGSSCKNKIKQNKINKTISPYKEGGIRAKKKKKKKRKKSVAPSSMPISFECKRAFRIDGTGSKVILEKYNN